jgi:DNA-binding response OmpR family regulator
LKTTNDETIDPTDAEFDVLVIFLRRPARFLFRDELMRLLKGRD